MRARAQEMLVNNSTVERAGLSPIFPSAFSTRNTAVTDAYISRHSMPCDFHVFPQTVWKNYMIKRKEEQR